jgi:site-specific DNA-cytosine methylase
LLQRTLYKKQNIDLSSAPWTMHEFFAGSGLVAYGLKGMFAPIWANDISEQKAAVYEANFGCEHFELGEHESHHFFSQLNTVCYFRLLAFVNNRQYHRSAILAAALHDVFGDSP